jgi:S-adenosylmethionine uptake transporter
MKGEVSQSAGAGILLILLAVFFISINDALIKMLSGGYPLHQVIFLRSAIGLLFGLPLLWLEGGWRHLRTDQPFLHFGRCLCLLIANSCFFAALAAMPLAEVTAIFFVAPLMITLLAIPVLGERVGPWRLAAVVLGFAGVLIMQRPLADAQSLDANRLVMLLPVLAAVTYAMTQVLTRKLGATSKASVLALYVQAAYVSLSLVVYLIAGDGRFEHLWDNPSAQFLLRAWIWPSPGDQWIFLFLGILSAAVGYCFSQAYRMANAATIAPYEYSGMLFAVIFGMLFFNETPDAVAWLGMTLIVGAGVFVFLREGPTQRRPLR